MKPTIEVETSGNDDLSQIIAELEKMEVYVGIPEENTDRPEQQQSEESGDSSTPSWMRLPSVYSKAKLGSNKQPVNNAQLLFIHTHGSPIHGIPARPVIEPAIEADDNKEAIADELARAAQSALEGDKPKTLRRLRRSGMEARNRVLAWFTDPRNAWAPNSKRPLGKWLAKKLSERYGREITPDMSYAEAKGSDRPLIDTDEMRKSITYVVTES